MIKVIKNGNYQIQPKLHFEKQCCICKCTFQFELNDLTLSYICGDDYSDLKFSISCPQCQDQKKYDYYQICNMVYDSWKAHKESGTNKV